MISRMLFVALEDHISVISVSERGKSNEIPFEGDVVFKLREDFWDSWKEQTAFGSMCSDNTKSGAMVDFCFICDKEYSFYSDEFLSKVQNVEKSIWCVDKIVEVMGGQSILENYQSLNVELKNGVIFTVAGSKAKEQKVISAWTNVSDDAYKEMLEEKERKEEQKRAEKQRALAEKKARELEKSELEKKNEVKEKDKVKVVFSEKKAVKRVKKKAGKTNEESALVRYNKILREKEEAHQ